MINIHRYYQYRYNIEHFFRFGKTKLLLDAYQTSELSHDEQWWQLCLLAYNQLYMGKSLVLKKPKPWEKYLPAYRDETDSTAAIATPSQTQRDFSRLLDDIGTPARICVPRGRNSGRKKGQCTGKKLEQAVIFKSRKSKNSEQKIIIPGLRTRPVAQPPKILMV